MVELISEQFIIRINDDSDLGDDSDDDYDDNNDDDNDDGNNGDNDDVIKENTGSSSVKPTPGINNASVE